ADARRSLQNGVCIHLFESRAAVFDFSSRNDLEPLNFSDGVLASMRLEISNDDVDSFRLELLRFFEHPIGFARPGGITEVDLQSAARGRWRLAHGRGLCGNTRTSIPSASSIRRSTGLPRRRFHQPLRRLWPMKICVIPFSRANFIRARTASRPWSL